MDESTEITVILLLGTGGMVVLVSFIVLFVFIYQKNMQTKKRELVELELESQLKITEALIESKEQEQRRVARELHDGIGSALTALKMAMISVPMEGDTKEMLDQRIVDISNDLRRISNELMPSILDDLGFFKALEKLITQLNSNTQLNFSYASGLDTPLDFSKKEALALYRVSQEIFNNIIKYADAVTVKVKDRIEEGQYVLSISDDGNGFSPTEEEMKKEDSHGLKNIKSRMQQVSGTIEYNNLKPKGTEVLIQLKLNHDSN